MGVPSEQEVQIALAEAGRMREAGDDPQHLAKVLLNHHYRLDLLNKVMHAAELYMRSGQSSQEHSRLIRAIEAARNAERTSTTHDRLDYGL